jgi:hypothetical protein
MLDHSLGSWYTVFEALRWHDHKNIPSPQSTVHTLVLFQGKGIYFKGTCGFSRIPRSVLPCPTYSWRLVDPNLVIAALVRHR